MKKKYIAPEMMIISIRTNEAFSRYTNCEPYMWGGAVVSNGCSTTENQAMYGYEYDICLEMGYPN